MSVSEEPKAPVRKTDSQESVFQLPIAKAMTFEEASSISAKSRTRLIVFAGAADSGKTTLIASLFHIYQRQNLSDFWFSNSSTLIGYDERCHDARTSSFRQKQDTERTKAGTEYVLLHLNVRHKCEGPAIDLLLLDMSGEDYEDALDSIEECNKLTFIKRADHFVLLIDGELLADISKRQKAKTEAFTLLRSCFDSGQLDHNSLVDVLISKWDLSESNADIRKALTEFTDVLEEQVKDRFGNKCARLRIAKVAARPDNVLPLGYGVEKLFPAWVNDLPQNFYKYTTVIPPTVASEFDRFGR
jgi:hypothetical protein